MTPGAASSGTWPSLGSFLPKSGRLFLTYSFMSSLSLDRCYLIATCILSRSGHRVPIPTRVRIAPRTRAVALIAELVVRRRRLARVRQSSIDEYKPYCTSIDVCGVSFATIGRILPSTGLSTPLALSPDLISPNSLCLCMLPFVLGLLPLGTRTVRLILPSSDPFAHQSRSKSILDVLRRHDAPQLVEFELRTDWSIAYPDERRKAFVYSKSIRVLNLLNPIFVIIGESLAVLELAAEDNIFM